MCVIANIREDSCANVEHTASERLCCLCYTACFGAMVVSALSQHITSYSVTKGPDKFALLKGRSCANARSHTCTHNICKRCCHAGLLFQSFIA